MRVVFIPLLIVVQTQSVVAIDKIVFGSCSHQRGQLKIFDAVLAQKPELLIMMGDTIYADGTNMTKKRNAYRKLARKPSFRRLRKAMPVVATWDDHDYGYNDANSTYGKKQASQRIFLDFLKEPRRSHRRKTPGVYTSYIYGQAKRRVQVILLDTRYFLSPFVKIKSEYGKGYQASSEPGKTILGETQWQWLEAQLRKPAEVRLIVSSYPLVSVDYIGEAWHLFPKERDRFFALLKQTNAAGVVLLSGDRHYGEVSLLPDTIDYPLYEFAAGGFNMLWDWGADLPNRYRHGRSHPVHNFGLVNFDWPKRRFSVSLHDSKGQKLVAHTLEIDDLQP